MRLIPGWDSVAGAHWWGNAYFAASICALILLGVFEVISHRYSERKDELAAIEREQTDKAYNKAIADLHDRASDAEQRAATLEKEAAQLSKDAETAKGQIASANAQAERARADAAAASERAARIERAAAWRVLSPDTRELLISGLARGTGGSVELSYSANDPEALFLASQFNDIFGIVNSEVGRALWNVVVQPRTFSRAIYWDVRISGQKDDVVRSLRTSFSGAAIEYGAEPIPNVLNDSPGMMIGGIPPSDAMIWVGPKRPPN